jgi:hypothetical protein
MNLSKVKSSPKLRRPAAPAETGLLKQQAYASLKDRIISGDYQAGAFLSERMLVADLGMSKTPIRSAKLPTNSSFGWRLKVMCCASWRVS